MRSPSDISSTSLSSSSTSSLWSSLQKAFTSHSDWPDKEEFLDVIYWGRQLLGLFLGLIWGLFGVQGALGLVCFVVVNAGLGFVYCSVFQNVDEDEYGGVWELVKEGFITSFAGFLVVWIIVFSGLHH